MGMDREVRGLGGLSGGAVHVPHTPLAKMRWLAEAGDTVHERRLRVVCAHRLPNLERNILLSAIFMCWLPTDHP